MTRFRTTCAGAACTILIIITTDRSDAGGIDFDWTGSCDATWGCAQTCHPMNWAPNGDPGATDSATIGFTHSVISNCPHTIGTLMCEGSLSMRHNLTVVNMASLNDANFGFNAAFSPLFEAAGPITIHGNTTMVGAIFLGAGGFTIADGTFSIFPDSTVTQFQGTTVTNNATVAQVGPIKFVSNAIVENHGEWRANANLGSSGDSGNFRNHADLKHTASGAHFVSIPLDCDAGMISSEAGVFVIAGGGTHSGGEYHVDAGAELRLAGFGTDMAPEGVHLTAAMDVTGNGTFRFTGKSTTIESGATLALLLNAAAPDHGGWFSLGATIDIQGQLQNWGVSTWSGALIRGPVGQGMQLLNLGELHIKTVGAESGPVLETSMRNEGFVYLDQNLVLNGVGEITNTGQFELLRFSVLKGPTSAGQFTNEGTVLAQSANTSAILVPFVQKSGGIVSAKNNSVIQLANLTCGAGGGELHTESLVSTIELTYCAVTSDGHASTGTGIVSMEGPDPEFNIASGVFFTNHCGETTNDSAFIVDHGTTFTGGGSFENVGTLLFFNNNQIGDAEQTIVQNSPGGGLLFLFQGTTLLKGLIFNHSNQGMQADGVSQDRDCHINFDFGAAVNYGKWSTAGGDLLGSGLFENHDTFVATSNASGAAPVTIAPTFDNAGTVIAELPVTFTGDIVQLNPAGVMTGGTWIARSPGGSITWGNLTDGLKTVGPGSSVTGGGSTIPQMQNLESAQGGSVRLDNDLNLGGGLTTSGGADVTIDADSTLTAPGGVQNGDAGSNNDTVESTPNGGQRGTPPAHIITPLLENYARLAPGGFDDTGVFNITGNVVMHETATLLIDINGTTPGVGHDQLKIDGDVTLDGTLALKVLPGYAPAGGEQFTVLSTTNGSIAGQFAQVTGHGQYTIQYNSNSVVVTLAAPPIIGDVNDNGVVDVTDLFQLLSMWGDCPQPCLPQCNADFNGDCVVNVTDLFMLLANWTN